MPDKPDRGHDLPAEAELAAPASSQVDSHCLCEGPGLSCAWVCCPLVSSQCPLVARDKLDAQGAVLHVVHLEISFADTRR